MQNINAHIGSRIRSLRLERGINQEQLADKAAIHRSHLGEIERGECGITMTTLFQIGRALDISMSTMLEGMK